ncbi:MAG: hypothetical protein SCALA702_25350 [Melioribacteraceae bacterium]|nr:MAG: hypothetical protein SCALA702_25350 [Melioribacteraceae bacterium]
MIVEKYLKYKNYILTGIIFIVYLVTLAPTVVQIDTGELATVVSEAGIAHPTGYPLFTILGFFFLLLPLPFTDIFAANLLASIYVAGGVFLFTLWSEKLFKSFAIPQSGKSDSKKSNKKNSKKQVIPIQYLTENVRMLAVTGGALLLAFSKTFWFQSTSIEVYSLHILLINLVIYSLVKAYLSEGSYLDWLYLAGALALAFSNHMTTLLILPGIAVLFFHKEKFGSSAFRKLGAMLALFFPLLALIYSYLPIRASMQPVLNWGNPVDFERFARHFMGKQYQVWLFSSVDSAKEQLEYFFTNFPIEFFYVGLILIIPGVFMLFKLNRIIGWFALVTFWSTVLYSINYDIADIDSYFLLAFIICGLWAAAGVVFIYSLLTKIESPFPAAAGIIIVITGIIFAGNVKDNNHSGEFIYEDYTKAVLGNCEENAIIFSYQWDYFISASYYFQYVEDYRNDVIIIDKELLRRSWYYDQLSNNYPGIFNDLENEVKTFREALVPFERSENYNASVLEGYFRKIMTGLVEKRMGEHPYYIAPEIIDNEMRRGEFTLPQGTTLVPKGLLYQVVEGNQYVEADVPDLNIRWSDKNNTYTKNIEQFVVRVLLNRAIYEVNNGYEDRAGEYISLVKKNFPSFRRIPPQLQSLW